MDNSIKITLIIISAVIFLAFIGLLVYFYIRPITTITVDGKSSIEVIPDLVTVYMTIETNGSTTKEANDLNSEITNKVIEGLMKLGFKREEIQTQNFNIYPNNIWEDNKIKTEGYKAVHSIKLRMTSNDTSRISNVVDIAADNGAYLNYIDFELTPESENKYKAQALKLATEDAKTKADSIAKGVNKKVIRPVKISEASFYYYPWRAYTNEAGVMSAEVKQSVANIQPSTREISASVNIIYSIS